MLPAAVPVQSIARAQAASIAVAVAGVRPTPESRPAAAGNCPARAIAYKTRGPVRSRALTEPRRTNPIATDSGADQIGPNSRAAASSAIGSMAARSRDPTIARISAAGIANAYTVFNPR